MWFLSTTRPILFLTPIPRVNGIARLNGTPRVNGPLPLAEFPLADLPLAELVDAQLLMVAGFVMLGWVLARRQLKMRKRVNGDTRAAKKAIQKIRNHRDPALPLCDAPPETQRWQVALFDLQRELKAELDTRIAVVQSLTRQVDERIERLTRLQQQTAAGLTPTGRGGVTPQQRELIEQLAGTGLDADAIAGRTGVPTTDVQRVISRRA